MKGKILKLIALFSALVIVFSLAACGEEKEETSTTATTTSVEEVEDVVEDVAENEEIEDTSGTDENGEEVTEEEETEKTEKSDETTRKENTTKKKDKENKKTTAATTKKNSDKAPVDGSIAEIVAFYNKAANATKAKQNFTYTREELTKVIIDSLTSDSNLLNSLSDKIIKEGNKIINRLTGNGEPVKAKEVFVNGKPTIGDIPKDTCMPIMESDIMSTLTADGVKSATCKKDGDGYVITIVLKTEKGTLQKAPPHHASCVNYLRLEALDLGILNNNIKSAEMNYIDSTNSGTKFVAKVNKNNLLDYMNTYMTINGGGTGKMFGITASATLHGTYECEYKYFW